MMSIMLLYAVISHAATPTDQENDSCIDPKASSSQSSEPSPLEIARNLHAPLATDTLDAEFEHDSFWDDHGPLFQDAWQEWEESLSYRYSHVGDDGFLNPKLSTALENAFDDPSEETESTVKSLWTTTTYSHDEKQPLPKGVHAMQLLTPSGISHIRNLLDSTTSSGIPTRRPNGMNRHGVIVDSDVYGAVSMKSLVKLVEEEIISRVVRPVGRMLFPDRVGCNDDLEYFAFTIKYDGSDDADDKSSGENDEGLTIDSDGNALKGDLELKEHRDASVVTLNINLNLPEEGYAGSEVYFRDYPSEGSTISKADDDDEHCLSYNGGKKDGGTVRFTPGMAIIHLGAHRHGSLPISTSAKTNNDGGKRFNLVIWLFGKDGDVRIAPYEKEEQMNVRERWLGCNHTQGLAFG